MGRLATTLLIGTLVGCSEPELPGLYYDLDLNVATDGCNNIAVDYSETLEYRLEIDVNAVRVSIGPDTFATGGKSGCNTDYSSLTYTETRDEGDIRWSLTGEASTQTGSNACGQAQDWIGTETFTVVSSDDPAVRPGCEYVVDVVGSFVREVE